MRDLLSYLRLIDDDLQQIRNADPEILSHQNWDAVRHNLADVLIVLHEVEYLLEID